MPVPDLKADVTFRGQSLNSITRTNTAGQTVITGCQVLEFDPSAVDIRQFTEPLALVDGIDVGSTWLGARHPTLKGVMYGSSRSDGGSRISALEAVCIAESGSLGYYDLVFTKLEGGTVTLSCRPNGLRYSADFSKHGGVDAMPIAIAWALTLFAKDPTF